MRDRSSEPVTRASRRKKSPTASSSLVIGVATLFVFLTAVVGLLADRNEVRPGAADETWSLRGEVDNSSSSLLLEHHT